MHRNLQPLGYYKSGRPIYPILGGSGEGEGGAEGGAEGGDEGGAQGFKPITSQDDLNRLIADRVTRERAKFKDYGDLKTKAKRLDELEEANKSETQKLQDQLARLQAERDTALTESLRVKVAGKHGITDPEDIALFLTGTDEETLTKQAKRLQDRTPARKGNRVAREGANPRSDKNDEEREAVRSLFGN